MTVSLKQNFFANSRGLTLLDSAGVTWSFDPSTNQLSATATGAGGATGANPTAVVGLAAINGVASTFIRSDGTPALNQGIVPAWTGAHAWSSTMAASANPLAAATTRVATGLAGIRSSNATTTSSTLATDAQLTLTFNETGWYDIEVWLAFFEATSGTGGFQFNFLGGASATYGIVSCSAEGYGAAALALAAGITSSTTAVSTANVSTSSSAPSWFRAKGALQVTAPGTGGVQWAQAATSANVTTLLTGSYVRAIKIG